jgi:hypothetical protein
MVAGQATDTGIIQHVHLHAGQLKLQTHSEYVILFAFTQQQWLHECALIVCLVY